MLKKYLILVSNILLIKKYNKIDINPTIIANVIIIAYQYISIFPIDKATLGINPVLIIIYKCSLLNGKGDGSKFHICGIWDTFLDNKVFTRK